MKKNLITLLCLFITLVSVAQENLLQSGPMVGYSDFREALIWVQTTEAAEVKIGYFAAGETEKTIDIPIVDNCDGAASLEFGFGLSKTDGALNNNIPDSLIEVGAATSKLIITNGSNPINFNGLLNDFTGVAARIRPDWKGDGRLYVTGKVDSGDLNPEMTEMGIKADVTHNCLDELVFNWSLAVPTNGTQLPSGNGLPNNFSILPAIAGSSNDRTATEKFKLPFVIKDTDMVVNLTITDPETGVTYDKSNLSDLERVFTVTQNFRTIENNGEGGNNCVDWEGVGNRLKNKTCITNSGTVTQSMGCSSERLIYYTSTSISRELSQAPPGGSLGT